MSEKEKRRRKNEKEERRKKYREKKLAKRISYISRMKKKVIRGGVESEVLRVKC